MAVGCPLAPHVCVKTYRNMYSHFQYDDVHVNIFLCIANLVRFFVGLWISCVSQRWQFLWLSEFLIRFNWNLRRFVIGNIYRLLNFSGIGVLNRMFFSLGLIWSAIVAVIVFRYCRRSSNWKITIFYCSLAIFTRYRFFFVSNVTFWSRFDVSQWRKLSIFRVKLSKINRFRSSERSILPYVFNSNFGIFSLVWLVPN